VVVELDEGRQRRTPVASSTGGKRQQHSDGGWDLLHGKAEEAKPCWGAVVREVVVEGHAEGKELAEVGWE
jgi:hypothetical protein